jgi:hypothetical protein
MKPSHAMVFFGIALGACQNKSTPARSISIQVDTVPFINIADSDPQSEPVLELPNGASRFANGNIAVGDYYGSKVVFFDSTGRFVRNVGRPGKGPGENGLVVWRGACAGDSVFIAELGQLRSDVIDNLGTVVRSFRDSTSSASVDCRRNGLSLGWGQQRMVRLPTPSDPPVRNTLLLFENGTQQRVLGEFEWGLYGPMRPINAVALGDDEVYFANATSGLVEAWSHSGKKLRSFDTGARQRPASDAHFEAALARWVWFLPNPDEREQMKQLARRMFPKVDRIPALNDLIVDSEGILWVVTSYPGDGHTSLEAFTATGSAAGSATLPVELTIFEIGADYLLGSFEDEEGFPHVVMYRVRRTTAS